MKLLKLFASYYKPYKGLFALDMTAAAIASLLSVVFPSLTRYLLNTVIPQSDYRLMMIIFLVMLLVYLVQMACTWIRIKWGHILGVWIENDMRRDIFSHLQILSFSYYDKTKTGSLMSRITNDLFNIAEVAHHCPEDFLISILTIAAAYVAMFSFSVPLALVTLIPLPVMLIYGIIYNGRLKKKNRAVRRTVADIAVDVENSIQGIREVKGYSQEKFQERKFDKSNSRLKKTREKYYAVMAAYQSGISFMREMYYFITVVGGVILITTGTVTVSDLVSFIVFSFPSFSEEKDTFSKLIVPSVT